MKNKIIEKIDLDKSNDIPIMLNFLNSQKTKILYSCEFSNRHHGDIVIENFYKFFCLNDVIDEKE
ncbi:MAG: hypothetical protein LBV69_10055 [Bacteroidales bacterium]|jgi:hypothetical protein|nr:hypothetical protein [Bacteroidales bacterium]